ncbi:glucokinase domain-containing protein [Ditylenchus destructor]|nr:glucokinase domain-containing protein [Ditylenchus destructor]
MRDFDSPRLIADIGGTFARFALETAPGEFEHIALLRCAEHPDFHAAVRSYIDRLPRHLRVAHAAIAIANPVEGDLVRMTNYHWQFSIEEARQRLGLDTLVVVNDFTALAMALPRLRGSEIRQIGGGEARPDSVIGLLGSGSGLGVSGLIPAGEGWISLGSEGGHTNFAPRDEREIALLRFAWNEYEHVSFERLLSGPGLELMHRAMADYLKRPSEALSAPEITARALEAADPVCEETLELFCTLLGTAAANLAVTLGALGGIYIGGGIVPRLGEYFDRSRFRARFEDKGRFSQYVAAIPTFVITAEHATFKGASAILEAQLRSLQASGGASAIVGQIRRARDSLSPAEQRVADHVLAHSRKVLKDPIAEIAKAASVSQPTVIRFCRSLGCEGLSDFKLRLASGLTGTVPVSHTQVTQDDSMVELGEKVLGKHRVRHPAGPQPAQPRHDRPQHRAAAGRLPHRVLRHRPLRRGGAGCAVQVPAAGRGLQCLHRAASAAARGADAQGRRRGRADQQQRQAARADRRRRRGARARRPCAGHHRQPVAAGEEGRCGADRRPRRGCRHAPADDQPHPSSAGHRHAGGGRGHAPRSGRAGAARLAPRSGRGRRGRPPQRAPRRARHQPGLAAGQADRAQSLKPLRMP